MPVKFIIGQSYFLSVYDRLVCSEVEIKKAQVPVLYFILNIVIFCDNSYMIRGDSYSSHVGQVTFHLAQVTAYSMLIFISSLVDSKIGLRILISRLQPVG